MYRLAYAAALVSPVVISVTQREIIRLADAADAEARAAVEKFKRFRDEVK